MSRLGTRLVHAAFNGSGIERRHSVITEWGTEHEEDSADARFFDRSARRVLAPGTKLRNSLYASEGMKLFTAAARKALAACEGLAAADVTHVITASCTGFFAPGPDYHLVRQLGLRPDVQRYHLGFMGCYAAFPALRAAKAFCDADPAAVVLVVAAEACSLHVRASEDPDAILANALFADGAAAAVVSAREPAAGEVLVLDDFETALTPVGEDQMAWTIGDAGFEMVLGAYVPRIIGNHVEAAIAPLLARGSMTPDSVRHWAIHPGGRSILDKVEARLGLAGEQLAPSRETLRDFGNMSSATVLFVLKRILQQPRVGEVERICAMAFGPGLTVESALFSRRSGCRERAA